MLSFFSPPLAASAKGGGRVDPLRGESRLRNIEGGRVQIPRLTLPAQAREGVDPASILRGRGVSLAPPSLPLAGCRFAQEGDLTYKIKGITKEQEINRLYYKNLKASKLYLNKYYNKTYIFLLCPP